MEFDGLIYSFGFAIYLDLDIWKVLDLLIYLDLDMKISHMV